MELAHDLADTLKMTHLPLALALAVLAGGCASGGGVPHPFPIPGRARVQPPPPAIDIPATASVDADGDYALVETALSLRGVPYRNGGTDPQGFDCSGFTQYVYGLYGMLLPREVHDQFESGSVVKGELLAGDLLFFTTVAPGATHVAIAIGGDQFIHAPSSTGVVRVERLSTSYWSARYLGARRVMPL
jgi:cell wall-associated NlpC family hydrolase